MLAKYFTNRLTEYKPLGVRLSNIEKGLLNGFELSICPKPPQRSLSLQHSQNLFWRVNSTFLNGVVILE